MKLVFDFLNLIIIDHLIMPITVRNENLPTYENIIANY